MWNPWAFVIFKWNPIPLIKCSIFFPLEADCVFLPNILWDYLCFKRNIPKWKISQINIHFGVHSKTPKALWVKIFCMLLQIFCTQLTSTHSSAVTWFLWNEENNVMQQPDPPMWHYPPKSLVWSPYTMT